jgi:DNA-binding transcriptional LysR family regulator
MIRICFIRMTNLASVDLNLLIALEALLEEAHVGRAAKRVGLSQPAMSHALRRLRELLGDALLVRTGGEMLPTARAEQLRGPLAAALEQVRALLSPVTFEPAESRRRFRLMMPDLTVDLLFAALVRRVSAEAPGVRLEVVPWLGMDLPPPELARAVDFVVVCTDDELAGFCRESIYRDRDALAVRQGHPLARRLAKLDVFLSARHVAVVSQGRREDMIDEWLRRVGHRRQVAAVTPSYLQALHVAAGSDLVAFVPRRLIAGLAGPLRLQRIEPPLDPGFDQQCLLYPISAREDPASVWLRRHLAAIGSELESGL